MLEDDFKKAVSEVDRKISIGQVAEAQRELRSLSKLLKVDEDELRRTLRRKAGLSDHKHKCPECKRTLWCNSPKDCPGEGKDALCGSCPAS
jgi:hypothetical protein